MPANDHDSNECYTIEVDHQYPEDMISEETMREDLNLIAIDDADDYSDNDYDEDGISDTNETEDTDETEDSDDDLEDAEAGLARCLQEFDNMIELDILRHLDTR